METLGSNFGVYRYYISIVRIYVCIYTQQTVVMIIFIVCVLRTEGWLCEPPNKPTSYAGIIYDTSFTGLNIKNLT